MGRFIAFVYGVVVYAIFFLTFLYLIGFLGNLVVPKSIDTGPETATSIAFIINFMLMALFGVQHSVTARPGFKARWTKIVPKAAERSTYVLLSSLILILLYWQWRPMGQVVWEAQSVWSVWTLWGVFAVGFLLVLLSTFVIDHFDLFGLRQVFLYLRNQTYAYPELKVTYFYRFVRHPIYVGWFLAFWGTPRMTLGHLVFAVGMSAYILVAIRYEERDLVSFHGESYVKYRERVPMLVPWFGKVHETVKHGSRRPVGHH